MSEPTSASAERERNRKMVETYEVAERLHRYMATQAVNDRSRDYWLGRASFDAEVAAGARHRMLCT